MALIYRDGSGTVDAFLFDCDGTIFPNVEKAHEAASCDTLRDAVAAHSKNVDYNLMATVWEEELGKGIRNFMQAYLDRHAKEFGETLPLLAEQLEADYEDAYIQMAHRASLPTATPTEKHFFDVRHGVKEAVAEGRANGVLMVVASNATQRILDVSISASGIQFDDVIGSDTATAEGKALGFDWKPKPEGGPFQCALHRHNVNPDNAIGFEDTGSGMQSLQKAGVTNIVRCKNHAIEIKVDQILAANDIKTTVSVSTRCNLLDALKTFIAVQAPQSQPQKPGTAPSQLVAQLS